MRKLVLLTSNVTSSFPPPNQLCADRKRAGPSNYFRDETAAVWPTQPTSISAWSNGDTIPRDSVSLPKNNIPRLIDPLE